DCGASCAPRSEDPGTGSASPWPEHGARHIATGSESARSRSSAARGCPLLGSAGRALFAFQDVDIAVLSGEAELAAARADSSVERTGTDIAADREVVVGVDPAE